jgi:hypothetical protein
MNPKNPAIPAFGIDFYTISILSTIDSPAACLSGAYQPSIDRP